MKFATSIFFSLLFFFGFFEAYSQVEKISKYSNSKAALIIDSLENQLLNNPTNNSDIVYELALLYAGIDYTQSKINAANFISRKDTTTSQIKLNIIYSLLADIYKDENNHDSIYHYLLLQNQNQNIAFNEESEVLKNQYLSDVNNKEEASTILGVPIFIFIIYIVLIGTLIFLLIYFSLAKKQQMKIETEKNRELEIANTNLQKFNNELQEAVMANTFESALELEKTSNEIVELRKSLRKAEESNYLKNAFLGTMSHQIRTPLSGIMGFSDILETELALRGNEDLYDFAKNIQEAGDKLMGLITNIIDISSIEANILELKINSCNLNEIVTSVEKEYVFKARDKGLIFKTKIDNSLPEVYADNVNLTKILRIILDNAIQYTNKGFVTMSTFNDQKQNNAIIELNDKGKGIDKESLKLLTDSFDYSKHGSSLTYQGNGLGLILAHRLITLMHGSLDIVSKEGKGTTIKITIPCHQKVTSTDHQSETESSNIKDKVSIPNAPEHGRIRIFVVEDDRMNRMVIEKMLKKAGDIVTANDGNDALKKLKKIKSSDKPYDVMLLDMNLPAPWDGMTLMNEIRKQYAWAKKTPFIAQTAYAMAGDKDKYLDAGFNDYISKPINKNELLTMIQKQLELFKSDDT